MGERFLETCTKKYRGYRSRDNSSRESRNLDFACTRSSGPGQPEGGTKAWRRDELIKRVAALRTAVVCSYQIKKKRRFEQPQQAQSRITPTYTDFRQQRKGSGRDRCPVVGLSLSGQAPIPEISIPASIKGSPSLSSGTSLGRWAPWTPVQDVSGPPTYLTDVAIRETKTQLRLKRARLALLYFTSNQSLPLPQLFQAGKKVYSSSSMLK